MNKECKMKKGFTLAEVLITLLTIGVVAALTIPALLAKIQETVNTKQHTVTQAKLAEGMRQMRTDGVLNAQYTTAEFVEKMKKYFKINAVCSSSNLTSCFASTINTIDENNATESFDVSTLTNANKMNSENPDSEVYGIDFADGVQMLIYYIPDCVGPADKPQSGDPDGNLFSCIKYIYDINGTKAPNTISNSKDMVSTVSLSKSSGNSFGLSFKIINDTTYAVGATATDKNGNPVTYTAHNDSDNNCYGENYYSGAVAFCQALGGNLPTIAQCKEIADTIYTTPVETEGSNDNLSLATDTNAAALWTMFSNARLFTSDSRTYYETTTVFFFPTRFGIEDSLTDHCYFADGDRTICVK